MKITTTSSVRVKSEFKLEMPQELQVQPKWTIELPAKRTALVFERQKAVYARDAAGRQMLGPDGQPAVTTVTYYLLIIRRASGMLDGRRNDDEFDNLLELQLHIEELAVSLLPKSAFSKTDTDHDE